MTVTTGGGLAISESDCPNQYKLAVRVVKVLIPFEYIALNMLLFKCKNCFRHLKNYEIGESNYKHITIIS